MNLMKKSQKKPYNSGFQKHPCYRVSQFVKIYYSQCTRLKVETQLLIESVPLNLEKNMQH
jgi:hypothetical protein